ncbi:MAG: hypothetical protein ACYDAG_10210 [Chloroflexota bacterium]
MSTESADGLRGVVTPAVITAIQANLDKYKKDNLRLTMVICSQPTPAMEAMGNGQGAFVVDRTITDETVSDAHNNVLQRDLHHYKSVMEFRYHRPGGWLFEKNFVMSPVSASPSAGTAVIK